MGIRMIDKLIQKIERTGAPIVVGLDPMLKYIPEHLQKKAFAEYGETLQGAAEAVWAFNKEIIDNLYDLIPAVKPQIAMYEQFGIEGLLVFKRTVEYCKEKGLIVIGDVKRGDIGSTSEAYAVGHLGGVQVGEAAFGQCQDFAKLKIDHIIGHKSGLNRFKNIEIVPCILSDHHGLRIRILVPTA